MGQTTIERAPRPRSLPPVPRWLPEHKLIEDADAIGDDVVALALLLLLRDIRLWVESPPEERSSLLLPPSRDRVETIERASARAQSIAEALNDLSAMRSKPERATDEVLNAACQRIARWAHRQSLSCIALLYAEAAARIALATASNANFAGRMARIAGFPDRSELWFDHGIRIAGRDGNRNRGELIRALLGKSTILREKGSFQDARCLLDRAARLCASTRRYRQAAETQHDLFALAVVDGTFVEAEGHMALAVEHYPIHHPAIPILIHDWCFLLVQHGYYSEVLPLLCESIPRIQRLEVQLFSLGPLARAAGGVGLRKLYDEAVQRIEVLVERTKAYAAPALAHAAYGARFFADWERAFNLATQARAIALARGEIEVANGVEEFLSAIRAKVPPIPSATPPDSSRVTEIHNRIMRLLKARERPVRRPVEPTEAREAGGIQVPASTTTSASLTARPPQPPRERSR